MKVENFCASVFPKNFQVKNSKENKQALPQQKNIDVSGKSNLTLKTKQNEDNTKNILLAAALCLAACVAMHFLFRGKGVEQTFSKAKGTNVQKPVPIASDKVQEEAKEVLYPYLEEIKNDYVHIKSLPIPTFSYEKFGQNVLDCDLERVSFEDAKSWLLKPGLQEIYPSDIKYQDKAAYFNGQKINGLVKSWNNASNVGSISLYKDGVFQRSVSYLDGDPYVIGIRDIPNVSEKTITLRPDGQRYVYEILDWTNPQLECDYYQAAEDLLVHKNLKLVDMADVECIDDVWKHGQETMNGIYKIVDRGGQSDFFINEFSNGDIIKAVRYNPFGFPIRQESILNDKYLFIDFGTKTYGTKFTTAKLYNLA